MTFTINPIPEARRETMLKAKVWTSECAIPLERLKLLKVLYSDFNNQTQQGELITLDVVAEEVIKIFKKLYDRKFPIAKMRLIDDYNGNDDASMEDNNSSCFNYRKIAGSNLLSLHGLGMAIDINPVQNPYLILNKENASINVFPKEGINYLNRNKDYIGKVEPIVEIFKQHGFKVWGGDWSEPIDYHHFQVDRNIAEKIAGLNYDEGMRLFLTQVSA
jgi:hypothetical protein